MEDSKLVQVANRSAGGVTYIIPDMQNLTRRFQVNEVKVVPFEELRRLVYVPGGETLLKEHLIINDKEVIDALGLHVEPEYFYTEKEIKQLFNGGMDEFLDCLDFAPKGVIDTIKLLAVTLPLNDVAKRQAIFDKTGFDVTKAIELGIEPAGGKRQQEHGNRRRAAVPSFTDQGQTKESQTGRRVQK